MSIVCARSGSKRIKNKNLQLLKGMPLVEHAIRHAKLENAGLVCLSTDDDSLEQLASKYRAVFLQRPDELAKDSTPIEDVIRDALRELKKRINKDFDIVVILYANVLRNVPVIKPCLKVIASDVDSAITVVSVGNYHPSWQFETKGGLMVLPSKAPHRMQDLSPRYISNGGALAVRTEVINGPETESLYSFMGQRVAVVEQQPFDCIDIETEHDLKMLRRIYD